MEKTEESPKDEVTIDTFAELAYKSKNYDDFKEKLAFGFFGFTHEKTIAILNIDEALRPSEKNKILKNAYYKEKKRWSTIIAEQRKETDKIKAEFTVERIEKIALQSYEEMEGQIKKEERENNPTLRKLDKSKGEYCYVERKYSTDKNFSFMGTDKIESYNDVAFIFKKLQTASIENAFALHVLQDDSFFVQHLSMGNFDSTLIHVGSMIDSVKRFNSKDVYFIHNHPSGNIKPSEADFEIFKKIKEVLGEVVKAGIIINVISGYYSTFNENKSISENELNINNSVKKKVKVLKFDRQVFYQNIYQKKITTAEDVAMIVSSQRFNNKDNLSLLILNNKNVVTANIHLPYCDLSTEKAYNDISSYIARFAGTGVIIYGRSEEFKKVNEKIVKNINEIKKKLKNSGFLLLDFVNVNSQPVIDLFNNKYDYTSLANEGLLNESKEKYNVKNNDSLKGKNAKGFEM